MFTHKLQIALAITLAFTSIISYPTSAQMQIRVLASQKPPQPPKEDSPPKGNRTTGGGLGGSIKLSCKDPNKRLTALVPVESQGKTISQHPNFWFFIPDAPEEIHSVEFSILTRNEEELIHAAFLQLPAKSGIISTSLPSSLHNSLEEGKFYHWYLKINCKGNTSSQPDLIVDGWVQRVKIYPNSDSSKVTPDIWYDAVTDLANRRLAFPKDEKLKNYWTKLLKSVGLEELAKEPLLGSVDDLKPISN